jgi:hypothetical protein
MLQFRDYIKMTAGFSTTMEALTFGVDLYMLYELNFLQRVSPYVLHGRNGLKGLNLMVKSSDKYNPGLWASISSTLYTTPLTYLLDDTCRVEIGAAIGEASAPVVLFGMLLSSCDYSWPDTINMPTQVYAALSRCVIGPVKLVDYEIEYQDSSYYDYTALMYACYYGQYNTVHTLVKDFNADVDYKARDSRFPLMLSIEAPCMDCVTFLLDSNADIEATFTGGVTPLVLSA